MGFKMRYLKRMFQFNHATKLNFIIKISNYFFGQKRFDHSIYNFLKLTKKV